MKNKTIKTQARQLIREIGSRGRIEAGWTAQITFDGVTGEMLVDHLYGNNNRLQYHNEELITIGFIHGGAWGKHLGQREAHETLLELWHSFLWGIEGSDTQDLPFVQHMKNELERG